MSSRVQFNGMMVKLMETGTLIRNHLNGRLVGAQIVYSSSGGYDKRGIWIYVEYHVSIKLCDVI